MAPIALPCTIWDFWKSPYFIVAVTYVYIPLFLLVIDGLQLGGHPNRLYALCGGLCLFINCMAILPTIYGICFRRHPIDHPLKKFAFIRIVFDTLFALSLLISSSILPSTVIPPSCVAWDEGERVCQLDALGNPCPDCFQAYGVKCMVPGVLMQLTFAGAMGYLLVICFAFAGSLYDPLKGDAMMAWWHHLLAWAWVFHSVFTDLVTFLVTGTYSYGLSLGQFCWVAFRGKQGDGHRMWILFVVPIILSLCLSLGALIYAFYCKRYFPSWHQNHLTFRMHQHYVAVFCAYFLPFCPAYIYLSVNLGSQHMYMPAMMSSLFTSGSLAGLLFWRALVCTDLVSGSKEVREEEVVVPTTDEYTFFLGHQRQFVAHQLVQFSEERKLFSIVAWRKNKLPSPVPDATPSTPGLPRPPSPAVDPRDEVVEYFLRAFGPSLWQQYQQLAKEVKPEWGANVEHHFECVRHKVWHQLMLIWRRLVDTMPEEWDMECGQQVLFEFRKQSKHNIGSGYMGHMCNDYINAVELALFTIATRLSEPSGYITSGSAKGHTFQPIPGFPSATYNDYAGHIFTEIQGLVHLQQQQQRAQSAAFREGPPLSLSQMYRRSVCKLELLPSHAGSTPVRMLLTHDQKYLIKQITHAEHRKLMAIAEGYYYHLREHPNSLLTRIVGCHAIRMHRWSKNIYFVVMGNVDRKAGALRNDTIVRCDLKGSWIARKTKGLDAGVLAQHIHHPAPNASPVNCKDGDVQDAIANYALKLPLGVEAHVIGEWTRALQEDSHFLCRNRLMDYSLLLILYRTGPPSVSIIDYLQSFNTRKRLEILVKSLRQGRCPYLSRIHGISCASPTPYAVRFSRNLSRLLETGALYDKRAEIFESFAGAAEHQHLARRWSSAQGLLKERAAQQAQAGRSSTPVLALRGPGSGRERFAAPPAQSDDTPLTI
eukprot:EG_transcript_1358